MRGALAATLVAAALLGPGVRPAGALASAWEENPHSSVRLITPYLTAPRDGTVWLGLHFRLIPEWHVYWKNSGDAGFPPAIDAEATAELGNVELLWPAPERYELPGDLVAFGYEDEVVYPVRAKMAAGGAETVEISLDLDYLVCRIDCVPYRYTLTVHQPVGGEAKPDPELVPLLDRWRERLPRPVAQVPEVSTQGWLNLADLDRPVLEVRVEGVRPAPGGEPGIFFEAHELFDPGEPQVSTTSTGTRFRVPLGLQSRLEQPPRSSPFAWTVTGLTLPEAPGDVFAVEARRSLAPATGEDDAEAASSRADRPPEAARRLPAWLAALGGGLLLAVTPGALVLVLLVLAGVRQAAGGRDDPHPRRGLRLAGAAGAGVVTGGLALLAAAALSGTAPGLAWARVLQEPVAVAALALPPLALSLRLWGLLGGPEDGGRRRSPDTISGLGAFAAGTLTPVLALPWPVPPAPGALERAATLGAPGAAAAGLALVTGLALPFLAAAGVLATRPSEPGAWRLLPRLSGRVREGLGFVALVPVAWLLYLLVGLVPSEDVAFIELAFLGTGLGSWAGRRAEGPAARGFWAAATVAAGACAVVLAAVA
ncbi:MAG: protein-disulfide reductase DsbD domain-containing protein [Thermoanaerobaculia bacterium]